MKFAKLLVSRAVSIIDRAKKVVQSVVSGVRNAVQAVRSSLGGFARPLGNACQLLAGVLIVDKCFVVGAFAQATDIASSLTELSTYWTSAVAIGVLVLLWVIGRMLVHRGTRG